MTNKNSAKYLHYSSLVLSLVAAVLAIMVISTACSSSTAQPSDEIPPASQDASSAESSVESVPSDDSQPSTPDIPSDDEPSEPEVSVDYETEIGIKYMIDITDYLQYIEPSEDYSYLVNLKNPIPISYVPENMVVSQYMRKDGRADQKLVYTAEMALRALMAEAALNGIDDVTITSAYRSGEYQEYLFNLYTDQEMKKNPSLTREEAEAITLTYSMKPGCSEHQTGLCLDMHNQGSATQAFGKTEAAKWLAANSYRFGFILRYPQDKVDVTGVEWEPWHFRFVGRSVATYMYQNNLCLEEYWAEKNAN